MILTLSIIVCIEKWLWFSFIGSIGMPIINILEPQI